ncbi:MAG TPA: hypothetical protein VKV26_23625 [Dehalococcoidia bacterium]|nr:hypothetical protein [Dehalococcoidia bacterium]
MFAGPHFGAVALGIARAAIDAFTELATVKMPRGTRTLLRGQPEVQTCLGNAEALVSSARAWQDAVAVDGWNTVAAGGVLVAPEFYSIAGRVFLGLDPGPKPW